MKECKQCGNIVANDKNVCDNCHHTLNAGEFIYICNKCGRIFGENDKVCPNCHTKPEIIVRKELFKRGFRFRINITKNIDKHMQNSIK